MIIRKLFKFEGAHIVRHCSSEKCRENIHGHSYVVEVFLTSDKLDNGYMVMDFCRLDKVKQFIESFDHTYSLWNREPEDFKAFIYQYNRRVAELPVSPSAEGYGNNNRICGSIPGRFGMGGFHHERYQIQFLPIRLTCY